METFPDTKRTRLIDLHGEARVMIGTEEYRIPAYEDDFEGICSLTVPVPSISFVPSRYLVEMLAYYDGGEPY